MDIWDAGKIGFFVAFVVPGFISLKCYQLAFPGTLRPASDQLLDAVSYSCINYALLAVPLLIVQHLNLEERAPLLYYSFFFFAIFVFPVLLVFTWKFIRTHGIFQRTAPHPTSKPWDYVFQQRRVYWAKVTLEDGRVIGGLYGPRSFSSSAPAEDQIYLEETWLLGAEGEFLRKVNGTAGVIVTSKNISSIELREYHQ